MAKLAGQTNSLQSRERQRQRERHITFYVEDTGPGVPLDKAESIFDRFVKLDNSKQGAGLGLSICRLIATNLGGKIWLDTSYNDGARFVLAIPKE